MTVTTSPSAGGNSVDVGGTAAAPATTEMVHLTIDGIPVSAPKGALVIRAAEQVGVQIPRFCDHPLLDPVGACRQCLVDISTPGPDGSMRAMPKPQASCTITISEGMEVHTQHSSPVADKAQQGVMELLLINHPLDCPVCDKGGECPLQNQALSNGRARSRFEDVKRTYPKPINISSEVLLDRERCVLCARCTRFSDQIAGDPFIALVERGALQQVGIYAKKPFESYFSGNTVQICPVGALTSAAYRFRARPFDLISTPSACEHCASGCAMRTDHRRGVVLRRQAANDPEVNEEWNCDKGRWAFSYATAMDRITEPLVRGEDGRMRVASWPEALDVAARGLEAARRSAGVGVLVGGRVSAEDAYAYSKLARVALQTNDIDFRARPASTEEAEFLASSVARTYLHVSYADLEAASSVVLVGFEPEDESPIVFLRLRKSVRKSATPVFTVAPFVSRGNAKVGATLVKAAPGTETEVLQAVARRADEVAAIGEAVFTPGAVILVGERLATVPGALSAAAALAAASGAKLAWIPRRAGDRGAVETGALPNLLPGGRPVGDPVAREQVADAWGLPAGTSVPSREGRDTDGIIAAARTGALSALVVGGVDPDDLSDPVAAREALQRAFVVSLEIRESAVTQVADVVLPVAAHQEKAGSFVDWEGRVRPFQAALASNYMSDHRVIDLLSTEMGEYLGVRTTGAAQGDMQALGPWTGERPAVPTVERVLASAPTLPTLLPGQAVLATWSNLLDGGRLQEGEPFLAGTAPSAVARLSRVTAAQLGVEDGQLVSVSTPRGSITVPALLTDMVDHVVWLPTNTPPSTVRASLGVDAGAVVTVTRKDPA